MELANFGPDVETMNYLFSYVHCVS